LRLGNMGLSGNINVDALVSLPGLRSVSFMFNGFSGPIPEFNRIGVLKGLYISGNRFSGEIPSDFFAKMVGLKKVWFSGNNFSGPIPSSLVGLSQLIDLHLENNRFSGSIPHLGQISLVSLNLTNNRLEGEIPASLSRFDAASFSGNPGLCGTLLGLSCNPQASTSSSAKTMALGLLAAFSGILLLMIVGIVMMRGRHDEASYTDGDPQFSSSGRIDRDVTESGAPIQQRSGSSKKGSSSSSSSGVLVVMNGREEFGMKDLMKAAAEVLGNGAVGPSYKATMKGGGSAVVVKRVKEMVQMEKEEFETSMARLGRLKHTNVLPLLAYHYRREEKLLIYEHRPKGSLLFLLHGDRGIGHGELNWPARKKIIQGTANGLGYLHEQLSAALDLPHGHLKSSNVLLNPDYEPLLSDYGFCSLITPAAAAERVLAAYRSPEASSAVSPKCDVFCLGILILEILTGKFPSLYVAGGQGGMDLVRWVRSAAAAEEGRRLAELLDPDIAATPSAAAEMEELLRIAAACTEADPNQRLDLKEAVARI
ncbi:hypothetical protein M569_09473, partial [Genlisea aurea]